MAIHRSLVRIRLEGYVLPFLFFLEKYFPFVCDVVVKLLLCQTNPEAACEAALLIFSMVDQWQSTCVSLMLGEYVHTSYMFDVRSWSKLSQSLSLFLHTWTGSSNAGGMEVYTHIYTYGLCMC